MAAACYPSFASVRMEATTGAAKRGGSIRCANFIALRHSACGPGCVKSRTGQKYVESISLLPSREGGYGTVRLLNRRNREGSSKRKLNFRLFTQPGPGTGVPPGLLSDSHPSVSGRRAGISEPSNNPCRARYDWRIMIALRLLWPRPRLDTALSRCATFCAAWSDPEPCFPKVVVIAGPDNVAPIG